MSKHVGCCRRVVVKYGGSSLADHERMARAAIAVAKEVLKGSRVAVVVSAMGKTTDLLQTSAENSSNGKLDNEELDDILAMGERISVRIFAAALRANNVQSRYFDPLDHDWPIITDDSFNNANPILRECEERIQRYVLSLVEKGVVPVIAGFVGRTMDGKVTTLGRGGSDTTAFILAKAMQANEVILVTDSDGIMSADPRIIRNPKRLSKIDVNTLVKLADSGTKFIHTKALKYKDPSINVKVINHARCNLSTDGTLITGSLLTELDVVLASTSPVASIAIVGFGVCENSTIMQELTESVRSHSSQIGLSGNHDSIIFYVSENASLGSLLEKIHEIVIKHNEAIAMSVRRNLAFLRIGGVGLEGRLGLVGRISETLRLNEMNIFGMLTIASSIILFVDWDMKERALSLIKNSVEEVKK